MKLATKIFLASALVIAVLVVVSALSLRAVGRLVAAHREIATRALPAARLTSAAYDGVRALARLEARFLILRDPQYATLWDERAARAGEDLDRLGGLLATEREAALLSQAREGFAAYRRLVAEERALLRGGRREQALRLAETEGRELAERVEANLQVLLEATHAAVLDAQAEAGRVEARTWAGVLMAVAAAVGLALLVTAVIAQRLTRSLRALSAATTAVAAGAFREPLPVQGRDEIAVLARAFNTMAARLQELDTMKETFLAAVSHELRSPLTSMREAAHLLGEEVAGGLNPRWRRLVTIIEEGTERLLRLVNRILELSRLRAGMLPLERGPVALDRVVSRAVEEIRPQAEGAGVTLAVERVGRRFDAMGDEDRLTEVAVNLVANAIRFTPRGGRVLAMVVDAGNDVEIRVEDTGIGIPASALPHIFDWYRQAHDARGGSGLGLALVRGLVEAHGGRVAVESREGEGSRFTVVLPRGKIER